MFKVKRQPIRESEKQVLLFIAKKGGATKYQIEKGMRQQQVKVAYSHATIHSAVENLVKAGLLEGETIGVTRVGLEMKRYKLTFLGLCFSIYFMGKDEWNKIAWNWKYVEPEIFEKWKFLKETVGKEEAQSAFWRVARVYYEDPKKRKEEFLENLIEETILYHIEHENFKDLSKWIKAFKIDEELRNYAKEFLINYIESIKKELKQFEDIRQQLLS